MAPRPPQLRAWRQDHGLWHADQRPGAQEKLRPARVFKGFIGVLGVFRGFGILRVRVFFSGFRFRVGAQGLGLRAWGLGLRT